MTEYVLDVSKWRCGSDGDEAMGEGYTCMRNSEGYSCCLGQFAKQFGAVCTGYISPADIACDTDDYYDNNFLVENPPGSKFKYRDSDLTGELIYINDSPITTPREKVSQIRELLEKHGHTLKVLNEEMLDEGYRD